MRKISVFTAIVFFAVLGFVSCSEDKKTELGWTNKSAAAINGISWADEDATWTKDGGYDVDAPTEQKEVTKLQGDVDCTIDPGDGNFIGPDSIIVGDNQTSLELTEGESYRYDIVATVPAKKK